MTDIDPKPRTLTVDGKDYRLDELSEAARAQLVNVRTCDAEIARLKRQLAIAQTARLTYGAALKRELDSVEPARH